ncbi:MAG: site-specific recombinase [Betaproteobacteria bacterium]|nr:site-specific recombinase [Betaproteobacteria bacterium]
MESLLAIEGGEALLRAMVGQVRPDNPDDIERATRSLLLLAEALKGSVVLRVRTRRALAELFEVRRAGSLYMNFGILPSTGFFSESWRRIAHSLLPVEKNQDEFLGDMLQSLFDRNTDEIWVEGIEDEAWIEFLHALRLEEDLPDADEKGTALPKGLSAILHSLWIISYRIAAMGFEPELLRLENSGDRVEEMANSPFFVQNLETRAFVECCMHRWQDAEAISDDEKQLLVLFDQCRDAVERIRRRSMQAGTSLPLTYRLQYMRDHLKRGEQLAIIAGELLRENSGRTAYPAMVALFKNLVFASCRKNDLVNFWQRNLGMTARRVTEYAGKAGEQYITETRSEYFSMARAALGAGACIGIIAFIKLLLHGANFAPLNEMLVYGLNYGLGFMFIYIFGFTIATKQPAMTANAIAASIGEAKGKVRDLENLVTLVARTTRSQLVAILGNVVMAIPVAISVSLLWLLAFRDSAISVDEAEYLLASHHLFLSGSLFFAAVAGVCLFLSGLIAGYFDNHAAYHRVPQRIRQLSWALRYFGERRVGNFADYVEHNLGALAGNFLFGFLLALAWGIGMLLGLPLDIRHVAFSSAYLGYALAAYDFSPPLAAFVWATAGVIGIGFFNLVISFTLALIVALRARGVTFSQGNQFLRGLFRRFFTRPGEFFLPPKNGTEKA